MTMLKTVSDDYPAILQVADRLSAQMRQRFLAAINRLTERADILAVIEAIQTGHYARLDTLLGIADFQPELTSAVKPIMQSAFVAGATIGHEVLPATGRIAFDLINPHAVTFAREQAAELVTTITDDARAAIPMIRTLVESSLQGNLTVRDLQRELRPIIRNVLGLTERQTQAVDNFHNKLIRQGIDLETASQRTAKYAEAQLRYRAEMIARTETMRAANEGQLKIWQENQRKGYLRADQKRAWMVTPDDKLCTEICEPMDGEEVGLDEPWELPDGQEVYIPTDAHPWCRCVAGLVL